MIDHALLIIGFASALGSGLIAGLLFAFSVAVMTALARLPAPQGIAAMQSINAVIVNPLFGLVLFGTTLGASILTVAAILLWPRPDAPWLLAGGLLYLIGGIAVTMVANVPLNRRLAAVAADTPEAASLWRHYLSVWTAWNHVRTVATLASLGSFIVAIAWQVRIW